jgi:predicted protein tyrosine phosphatase
MDCSRSPTSSRRPSFHCRLSNVEQRIELRVLSREAAERYEPRRVEVCISIGDPGAAPAQLSRGFVAVLRLAFNDIVAAPGAEDVLFAASHAEDVLRFVEHWPHVERIVVHCGAGASRSPGVALGLCDAFGWPVAELEGAFPSWNRLVRSVMAQRAAVSITPPET